MPVKLRWVNARSGRELGPGLVREGKNLILRDEWTPEKQPTELTLYEEEGWLAWTLRTLKGEAAVTGGLSARENPPESGTSEARWKTQVGSLKTMHTTWKFWDKANKIRSGPLRVTGAQSGALITEETESGGPIPVEPAIEYAGVKASIKTEIPAFDKTTSRVATYVSVVDPLVTCRLLVPWRHGKDGLLDFIVEHEPGISRHKLEQAFKSQFGPDVFTPPEHVDIKLEEPQFKVKAGGSKDVLVTVSSGRPSEVPIIVAVYATSDDSELGTLSEVVELAIVGQVAGATAPA